MTDILSTLLGWLYWIAIIGGVGWWIWVIRRSSKPRRRSDADTAELARARAALAELERGPARGSSDREQARG